MPWCCETLLDAVVLFTDSRFPENGRYPESKLMIWGFPVEIPDPSGIYIQDLHVFSILGIHIPDLLGLTSLITDVDYYFGRVKLGVPRSTELHALTLRTFLARRVKTNLFQLGLGSSLYSHHPALSAFAFPKSDMKMKRN